MRVDHAWLFDVPLVVKLKGQWTSGSRHTICKRTDV